MSELIMQSFGGRANENIEQTQKRLLSEGSWRKQRIICIMPASNSISTKVMLTQWNLIFPPNQANVKIIALGMEVGAAYSEAIEGVLAHPEFSKWEYILTLEHDNMPPPDGVLRLIKRMEENPHLDCIGGLYFTKGDLGVAQIWGDKSDPVVNFRPVPPDINGGLVECYGTGMGFNLFRIKMFKDKDLPRPLFKTLTGLEGQGVGTQDLTFWSNAQKLGYRCAIDCGISVGHYDSSIDMAY